MKEPIGCFVGHKAAVTLLAQTPVSTAHVHAHLHQLRSNPDPWSGCALCRSCASSQHGCCTCGCCNLRGAHETCGA